MINKKSNLLKFNLLRSEDVYCHKIINMYIDIKFKEKKKQLETI